MHNMTRLGHIRSVLWILPVVWSTGPLSSSVWAQQGDVLTSKGVARLRSVTSVVVSPDGQHIAYTLSVPRDPCKDKSGPSWTELHVATVSGETRPFVTGEVNVGAIQWTPDGRGISFLAKRGKDKHRSLYVIPIDGGEAHRVLAHETDIREYSWSPDGRRVVFVAKDKKNKAVEKLKKKGFNAEVFEEDVLAVRAWIARIGDDVPEPEPMKLPGTPSDVVWAPVGSHIALALAPTPFVDDALMARKLHVFDADTGSIVSSFKNPGKLGKASWSPDGKRLAFRSAVDVHDPSAGRLMLADPANGTLTNLVPGYEGDFVSQAWLSSEEIMFIADEGVWSTFGEVRFDGTKRRTHIPAGTTAMRSFSLSRDGQTAALLIHSPKHPYELFVMRHGDSGPRRITNSNPWLDEIRLAEQSVETYKSRDGVMIQGLLIHPLGEEPGTRYPLIVNVHGGPEAHYTNGWITRYASPGQVAAARGFAVFYPNYRGSTGRGVEFAKAHQADYGGKEFNDVVDGVDYLIAKGLVDRDRVGVTGGSYGGYATAWCSTYYTKRFAAGVMFVGISDQISKSSTTDIPNEMTLVHARKRLWDDWDFFLERSPIRYVEQARTPLLILGGKDDTRVHPSQSLELYRNLKVLGNTPVRLVRYPGEGHGNRKSGARYDYNLRMLRWMEHYLVGDGGAPPPYELDYACPADKDEVKDKTGDTAAGDGEGDGA